MFKRKHVYTGPNRNPLNLTSDFRPLKPLPRKVILANRKLVFPKLYALTKPKTNRELFKIKRFGRYRQLRSRIKRKRRRLDKKLNYKSKRYIGYYFRYARNYLRNRKFFLKNIMVIKRFMAFGSGQLRKRQFYSIVKKVNSKIVRPTDARMQFVITFFGILANALYRVKFAHPKFFKFMSQLICRGYIMVNEKLARFPNMFVVPGDKLEVVHGFWRALTRPYYLKKTLRRYTKKKISGKFVSRLSPKQRRQKRKKEFFNRARRLNINRRRIRRYVYFKDKQVTKTVYRHIHQTRRARWKLKFFGLSRLKRERYFKKFEKKPKTSNFVTPDHLLRRNWHLTIKKRLLPMKKSLYKGTKSFFTRMLQFRAAYVTRFILLRFKRKSISHRLLRKLSRAVYFRFFKRFRRFPTNYIHRKILKVKKRFRRYFSKNKSRFTVRVPRYWQICLYARTAYMIKPTLYKNLVDKRFKPKFLATMFKIYHKFRY